MKILMVSPYEIYPPTFGGQVRIFNIAKYLAKLGHEVTVACNYTGLGKKKNFSVDKVKIIFFKTYIQDLVSFLNKFGISPLIISYPFHVLMRRLFKRLFVGYNIVQFEQPFLACWLNLVPQGVLKVYSSQNVELDFDLINFKKSLFYPLYKKILTLCEGKALRESDKVITVSDEDKRRFISLYKINKKKIIIIENGFDFFSKFTRQEKLDIKKELQVAINKKVAVFVGSAASPNIKAVKFITETVAPKNSKILFLLLGDSARTYHDHKPNIIKIGKVDNLDRYLAISDIGLLPITEGSGSNLKLLNYLRFGLQVISTDFGVRGYKKLKKYIKITSLKKFSTSIRNVSTKSVPKEILQRYEWRNLIKKLNRVYIKALG